MVCLSTYTGGDADTVKGIIFEEEEEEEEEVTLLPALTETRVVFREWVLRNQNRC